MTREAHYFASCFCKYAYDKKRARKIAKRNSRRTGYEISAYPCRFCRAWHIGHADKPGLLAEQAEWEAFLGVP